MKPIVQGVRDRAITKDDAVDVLNRELVPVLRATRELANRLAAAPEKVETFASSLTVDWSDAHYCSLTLTASPTLDFIAPPKAALLVLRLIQDATGGHAVTWPSSVLWQSGATPVITVAANAVDVIVFYCDGTNYYGVPFQAFS